MGILEIVMVIWGRKVPWVGVKSCVYLRQSDGVCCKNFIPYVWDLVLSQVPIEWWVINMNIHSLLYIPGDLLWLPINYGEAFGAYWVPYRMAMMVYRGWGPEVFLGPVPKGSAWFPYYSSRELMCGHYIYMWPHFLKFVVPVLGAMRSVLMVLFLWNAPVYPSCCMSFWAFPPVHGCMVPLWRCFCCLIYCCSCCWVGYQWLFIVDVVFAVKFVL